MLMAKYKVIEKSIREVEKALSKVSYNLTEKMKKSREFSRSLFVVKDMKSGEIFTEENIRSIRLDYELPSKYLKDILGKKAKRDISKGVPFCWDLME